VLDNCEHLVAGCAALAETLLRACATLRILATSRERLAVAGETVYRVPSLTLPEPGQASDVLAQAEAVALFVAPARAQRSDFVLTEQNAEAVAAICRRLDGIPLAVELAAARVASFPVAQIAARLDDCFRLLAGGHRSALPRQQTLRATLDWSYHLLSPAEQVLFRRLAVFAGGWTLEAAEVVCAGEAVQAWEVLELLAQLVHKSLVPFEETTGQGRYHLLDTARQFAAERLDAAGERETVRDRHLGCFLALAESAEPALAEASRTAPRWLDRLELEHDNLRVALRMRPVCLGLNQLVYNSASASSSTYDPNTSNNSASVWRKCGS
jgi:predicted ATPase